MTDLHFVNTLSAVSSPKGKTVYSAFGHELKMLSISPIDSCMKIGIVKVKYHIP